jgi:uncharacterized protein YjbI with pentapeptide repeats
MLKEIEADPDLREADLCNARLAGANLGRANLTDANLSHADLRYANLNGANLTGANLVSSNLREAQLEEANLSWARLVWAELHRSNLRGANLSRASLHMAVLPDADLSGVNLEEASFSKSSLLSTNFTGANFTRSLLNESNFTGSTFCKANLSDALIVNSVFARANLSGAVGLDKCRHYGPSTIDYSTFAQSGPLPLEFLRGCGLPETLITYLPSILSQPIQFYSCFISYSTKDQDFADRLYADLQNKGVRCWFAARDMQGGKKLHEQIDQAIRVHDRVLLILSTASMSSEWVKTEIAKTRTLERREKRRMLFPLSLVKFGVLRDWECFDADTGKDSAREIREIYIPDFSNWKNHDAYQTEFDRLIRDLKAEAKSTALT